MMAKFESTHRPTIKAGDLEGLAELLKVFDEVTFNGYGEFVALLNEDLPIIGPVNVSLYVQEHHVQVCRGKYNDPEAELWDGYLHKLGFFGDRKLSRDAPLYEVKRAIWEKLQASWR